MKEKRSLFKMIFGSRPEQNANIQTSLRMMNGFAPTFSSFSGEAYDSDVVRSAVDAIARNAAKLKPKHIRRVGGEIQETPAGNLEKLLAVQPNPYMDAYTFYYKVVTQLYMKNNSFIFIDIDRITRRVRGFYPIHASTVDFLEHQGDIYAKFSFMGGEQVVLPYEDLIHLRRFFYKNDLYGETNDKALTPTLQLIQTTDEGISNAVQISASLRGLLKFTNMLKPADLKKQRDDFVTDYMSISNNGGVAATDSKADFVELKNEPKMIDSKQMDAIKAKVYDYFGVNDKIIRSNYDEQEWNAFYESVIEPIAIQMSLGFTSKLFTANEKGHGNEIIFEANRMQYASNDTKVKIIETLVDRGMMSINQGLEVFNLPPVKDGDRRIMSLNFIDADKASEYQLGKVKQPPDKPKKEVNEDDDGANEEG